MRALVLLAPLVLAACGKPGLDAVHEEIAAALPQVAHIDAGDVMSADEDAMILFDVRTAPEFAVSRVPGAIRVEPGMDPDAFMAAHGEAAAGKTAVFYCSVGWRSSLLADGVRATLAGTGGQAVNLRGGAFGWANEGLMLAGPEGPTARVHGYDRSWARLIADEENRVLP